MYSRILKLFYILFFSLEQAKLLTSVQEALGLNVGQDADYPTEVFCGFPQSLQAGARALPEIYHILSNSSVTNYCII
jgi:hypothetical protein